MNRTMDGNKFWISVLNFMLLNGANTFMKSQLNSYASTIYQCVCHAVNFFPKHFLGDFLNTQHMANPTIVYPVKMEYGWHFSIFGLKVMVKSGLEFFFFWNSSMRETTFPYFIKVPKITNSIIKITIFPHGGISKYFFLDHFSPSFLGDTDSILRVKTMYESVK